MKSLTLVFGLVIFAVSVSALPSGEDGSSEEVDFSDDVDSSEDESEENSMNPVVPSMRSNGQETLQSDENEDSDEDESEENSINPVVPSMRSNGQETLQSDENEDSDEDESDENSISTESVVPARRSNGQETDLLQSIMSFFEKTVNDYKAVTAPSRRYSTVFNPEASQDYMIYKRKGIGYVGKEPNVYRG